MFFTLKILSARAILRMHQLPYPYLYKSGNRYTFTSVGKANIVKVVEFVPTGINGLFNLAFGDSLEDESIDDMATSNNGDMVKVLSTVVYIVSDFFDKHPNAEVFFTGSTIERTALYQRILRTYYRQFNDLYVISVTVKNHNRLEQIKFNPTLNVDCFAFFIRRK